MEEPDEEIAELASRVFNLAREGNTDDLISYIEAGLSPDLANQNGDSLLMLAAYHGHPTRFKPSSTQRLTPTG